MSKLKVYSGIGVEHWLDKALREKMPWETNEHNKRSIACPGNYIRIPAKAWVAFQELKNKASGKQQSLYDASREYESK